MTLGILWMESSFFVSQKLSSLTKEDVYTRDDLKYFICLAKIITAPYMSRKPEIYRKAGTLLFKIWQKNEGMGFLRFEETFREPTKVSDNSLTFVGIKAFIQIIRFW